MYVTVNRLLLILFFLLKEMVTKYFMLVYKHTMGGLILLN